MSVKILLTIKKIVMLEKRILKTQKQNLYLIYVIY